MVINLYEKYHLSYMFQFYAKARIDPEKISFVEDLGASEEYVETIRADIMKNGLFGITMIGVKEQYIGKPIDLFKIHMACGKVIYSDTDPLKDSLSQKQSD